MAGRKQTKGLGTVEKSGKNTWRIRVSLGKDPETGKYLRSPSRIVEGTHKQAWDTLVEYHAEITNGTYIDKDDITVREYAKQFHDGREKDFKSPLAWKREEYEIEAIKDCLGSYILQELDTRTIRLAYARLRKSGYGEGKMHRIHQKLSQMLKQALSDEIIYKNPCDPISIPRPKPKERESLSLEDAQRLNKILLEEPCSSENCAILLALHTGMRRGEVLGLTWENVHFDKRKIYVCKQYAKDKTPRDPKSKKSKRWLSIDKEVMDYLTAWKEEQKTYLVERKARLEKRKSESPTLLQTEESPVVTNQYGGYYCPDIFGRWFRDFCVDHEFGTHGEILNFIDSKGIPRTKKTGYEGLNFHELRHTQATLLIGSGADIKTVQNRLGHSSASLTMDIYSHAIEQNDRAAADEIGGLLTKKEKDDDDSEEEQRKTA